MDLLHSKIGLNVMDMLVIAPHPDDAELGMGGTIAKMVGRGWTVGILDLTDGEPTPYGSPEVRARETEAATAALGIQWRRNAGLPNRSLEPSLAARALIAGILREVRPRWVFAPYWEDAHPDHVAATQLIEAARFWAKLTKTDLPGQPFHPERIYYYYCIHLRQAIQPAWIVDISEQWEQKWAAIRAFESQFIINRPTDSPTLLERFRDDAAYWGKLIQRRYGEPFATREPLALSSLEHLL